MTEDSKRIWIRVMQGMRSTELEYDPPDEIMKRVLKLAGTSQPPVRPPLRLATLVYNSVTDFRTSGVRRQTTPPRHLVCRSGGVQLSINLQPFANDRISLIGQVSVEDQAESVDDVDVWMECNERLLSTRTDDYGEFIFHSLPPAEYKIAVLLAAGSIILPSI